MVGSLIKNEYSELMGMENTFVFDDSAIFTFNHPEHSNLAAVQNMDDLSNLSNEHMLEQFEEEL